MGSPSGLWYDPAANHDPDDAMVPHHGTGPFGPVRTLLHVVHGRKQMPRSLLRFLCTSSRDVEGCYGVAATPAQRATATARVARRMAQFGARFPEVQVTP
jgi:hypothetical protein